LTGSGDASQKPCRPCPLSGPGPGHRSRRRPEALRGDDKRSAIPPLYGALLKNEQDVHLFEQLVFLDRRTNPQ